MKKLSALFLGAMIAFGSAAVSEAQLRTGTQETGFSGLFTDQDRRAWQVQGYYGYFYNPNLQFLGIGQLQGGSGQDTVGSIGPGVDWHFAGAATENFVPFAGASYLIGLGSDVADLLEFHVGVKQFLARNTAIRYQVGWGFDPSETSDSGIRATVGLSYFF
jgi:hypothetical protein